MFDRIFSVDWSGAGTETETETDGVDLRVAAFDAKPNRSIIMNRTYQNKEVASWSRKEFRSLLINQLCDERPALVALDFGFGMPWGTDRVVFDAEGWHDMLFALSNIYSEYLRARPTAEAINNSSQFRGHGPYRFDDSRSDFRFYLDQGISYYRLTELLAPQAISQWYLGSGGTVGFHTMSGFHSLNMLLLLREMKMVDFEVWPHENLKPDGSRNVLVESYPAITPQLEEEEYGPCRQGDSHQRDARRVLQMLVKAREAGTLGDFFDIREQQIGRVTGVDFWDQIRFEGYIFGLR